MFNKIKDSYKATALVCSLLLFNLGVSNFEKCAYNLLENVKKSNHNMRQLLNGLRWITFVTPPVTKPVQIDGRLYVQLVVDKQNEKIIKYTLDGHKWNVYTEGYFIPIYKSTTIRAKAIDGGLISPIVEYTIDIADYTSINETPKTQVNNSNKLRIM